MERPVRRRALPGLLLLACLAAAPAVAQRDAVSVTAQVDSARIGLQDTIELLVEVRGSGFTSVEPPDLRDLDGFEVLDGPRRVQRQSIVNGRFTASVQNLWTLGPRRKGNLAIPQLTVRVDGRPFRTERIGIEVVEGSVAARVPSSDRFGRTGGDQGEVRLEATVDRSRAYVGQQITFTLRLLTQLPIRGMAYQTRADFQGFWAEKEIDYVEDPPGRIEGSQVMVDGKAFSEYVLARVALFPTASGTAAIDPINLQLRVRGGQGDVFSSFFFEREQTVLRRTSPIQVEVLPLPAAAPAGFGGAVGSFRLDVEADRAETVVNEAVGFRVSVSGEGNVRSAGAPDLPALTDFRAFDPTMEESHEFRDGRYRGRRTWEYVLVPLAPGEQRVPEVRFSYFDPEAARYRTLRSEPISIRVGRGDGPEVPQPRGVSRQAVTAIGRDIHFIKLADRGLLDRGEAFHRTGGYLALLALPLLLNAGLLAWRVRSDRLRADVGKRRSLGARRAFRRAMRDAEAVRGGSDAAAFHAAVASALTGLIADKCNLAAAGLTRERLRGALRGAGVEDELRREIEAILDRCDAARFAPGGAPAAESEDLLERAGEAGRRLGALR